MCENERGGRKVACVNVMDKNKNIPSVKIIKIKPSSLQINLEIYGHIDMQAPDSILDSLLLYIYRIYLFDKNKG